MNLRSAVCLSMSTLVGCASTNAEPGFRDMAATVQARTGHTLRWNRGAPEDQKAAQAVHGLLLQPLTIDSAVQIALLRNPRLQATYEDLSLAQADVVQAGLLSNDPRPRSGRPHAVKMARAGRPCLALWRRSDRKEVEY